MKKKKLNGNVIKKLLYTICVCNNIKLERLTLEIIFTLINEASTENANVRLGWAGLLQFNIQV